MQIQILDNSKIVNDTLNSTIKAEVLLSLARFRHIGWCINESLMQQLFTCDHSAIISLMFVLFLTILLAIMFLNFIILFCFVLHFCQCGVFEAIMIVCLQILDTMNTPCPRYNQLMEERLHTDWYTTKNNSFLVNIPEIIYSNFYICTYSQFMGFSTYT